MHTIFCKRCGAKREVFANNYRQVEFCKECYYDIKREYNSKYQKAYRERKKLLKQQQNESKTTTNLE